MALKPKTCRRYLDTVSSEKGFHPIDFNNFFATKYVNEIKSSSEAVADCSQGMDSKTKTKRRNRHGVTMTIFGFTQVKVLE